jgi:hypothetical protein
MIVEEEAEVEEEEEDEVEAWVVETRMMMSHMIWIPRRMMM